MWWGLTLQNDWPFELLADLTVDDGALTELQDLGNLAGCLLGDPNGDPGTEPEFEPLPT